MGAAASRTGTTSSSRHPGLNVETPRQRSSEVDSGELPLRPTSGPSRVTLSEGAGGSVSFTQSMSLHTHEDVQAALQAKGFRKTLEEVEELRRRAEGDGLTSGGDEVSSFLPALAAPLSMPPTT